MEHAAEALKMAGSVFMFVIALSVSIASFSSARLLADDITYNIDREMAYVDSDNYYHATDIGETDAGARIVGRETVIPTIKRALNENYIIQFDFTPTGDGDASDPLYTIKHLSQSGGSTRSRK